MNFCHNQGYDAYTRGKSRKLCPYNTCDDRYEAWQEGYSWAEQDVEDAIRTEESFVRQRLKNKA